MMSDTEPQVFSLVRRTQKVTLQKEDGTAMECEVREFDGKQRDSYNNQNRHKIQRLDSKTVEVTNFNGTYSLLLSMTIVNLETGKFIPEAEIQTWPDHVQEALFNIARKLNGLKTEDEQKAEKLEAKLKAKAAAEAAGIEWVDDDKDSSKN
jgi:hypothetical protein